MATDAANFDIGRPVRRIEDERFLRGRGHYHDDVPLEGALTDAHHAVFTH